MATPGLGVLLAFGLPMLPSGWSLTGRYCPGQRSGGRRVPGLNSEVPGICDPERATGLRNELGMRLETKFESFRAEFQISLADLRTFFFSSFFFSSFFFFFLLTLLRLEPAFF